MPEIKIHSERIISTVIAVNGSLLLDFIRQNGFEIYSPCGGNGTCGKCKVFIKGVGDVTSCLYKIENDIEIILPGKKEVNILTSQYEYSLILPFNPGDEINKFSFPLGIAIDLGTTTMVFYLINLLTGTLLQVSSVINPQAFYGSDVIARINFCIQNENGLRILQSEVIRVINEMIYHFSKFEQETKGEIVKMTITGNTTMLHLLAGVNPSSIAFAPFTPVFTDEKTFYAGQLGIKCNPKAIITILPSLTAYIGADIIAGLCTLNPEDNIKNYLFLDIGTNGEMALVTPGKVFCCATAAGPAFEGANISCGMGGVEGAISEYGTDGFITIGDTPPEGICGSGLLDITAVLLNQGMITPDGYMKDDFVVVPAKGSATGKPVVLRPADIRELQLAKAAIAAGINILLNEAGLKPKEIDALFLAGGFGNYLNTESALDTGLIPAELGNRIIPVGNTSGTGAVIALKSVSFKNIIEKLLQNIEYIELSTIESFAEEFVMNMMFPNRENTGNSIKKSL